MSEADADVVGRGANKVEEMDLRHTSITLHQVTTILEQNIDLDTELKKIAFGFVEVFSRADATLLRKLILETKFVIDYQTFANPELDIGSLSLRRN